MTFYVISFVKFWSFLNSLSLLEDKRQACVIYSVVIMTPFWLLLKWYKYSHYKHEIIISELIISELIISELIAFFSFCISVRVTAVISNIFVIQKHWEAWL